MREICLSLYRGRIVGLVVAALCGFCAASAADAPTQIGVTLKDHRFEPAEIHVQTGKPIVLVVTNQDPTAEEFDSTALKVEKVIAGGHYATIRLRPLGPGRYPFMGEFHPDTATGVVVSE
jgi:plastocyanin